MDDKNYHLSIEGISFEPMTEDEAHAVYNEHGKLVEADIGGIGHVTAAKLIKKFRSVEGVGDAATEEIASIEGVSERMAERIKGR